MEPVGELDSGLPSCLTLPGGTVAVGVDEVHAVAVAEVAAVAAEAGQPLEPFDYILLRAAFGYNLLEAFDHPLEASVPAVEDILGVVAADVKALVVPALGDLDTVVVLQGVLRTYHRLVLAVALHRRAAVAEKWLAVVEKVVQDEGALHPVMPLVAQNLQTAEPEEPFDGHLFDHIRRMLVQEV